MGLDPFGEAEERYHRLVEERKRNRLDPRAFRSAVRELAVRDAENREWMLGPEDGLWYRRDRDQWLLAEPPRRAVCPKCGHHNLVRHSFCVECGGKLGAAS